MAPRTGITKAQQAALNATDKVGKAAPAGVPGALPIPERTLDTVLQDMEELAIYWGGVNGTKLRNLVGEARKLK